MKRKPEKGLGMEASPQQEAAEQLLPADLALIRQVRRGSLEALGELYRRHAEMVYWVGFRITRSREEAEDILQDVFVGLRDALRHFDDGRLLEPWLTRLAVNLGLNRVRAAKSRGRREASYGESRSAGVWQRVEDRLMTEGSDAQRGLERLPEGLRVVLLLREIEGYSHREIGELLGISSGASASRLFRARRFLHRESRREQEASSRRNRA